MRGINDPAVDGATALPNANSYAALICVKAIPPPGRVQQVAAPEEL
jgi:hypothetical protein